MNEKSPKKDVRLRITISEAINANPLMKNRTKNIKNGSKNIIDEDQRKRHQIHLYLTENLYDQLQSQAEKWGLRPSQYLKFMLVRDLGSHATDLNIRTPKE